MVRMVSSHHMATYGPELPTLQPLVYNSQLDPILFTTSPTNGLFDSPQCESNRYRLG